MLISRAREFYERTATLRDNRAAGCAFALATVALALLARLLFAGSIGAFPLLAFIPAVLVTGFICGWRAGLLAAVLGALTRWYFYVPEPVLRAAFDGTSADPSPLLRFCLYGFAVLVILTLVAVMHLAFRDFAASERARAALNARLEMRVRERTEELEAANQRLRDEAASRAAAEAQIRQMQKMEAVGQLTGGIAHDFNNMLAIVVGSLDIARRHLDDREKAERLIGSAMEGAQRGAQLTARLLAFSRRQPLDARPLDTNDLVRDMSNLLTRSIGENIRLETRLAEGLWRTFADPSQLESALVNLCVNSRDAMPEGGCLTLETANATLDQAYSAANVDATPGDYVVVSVSDSGTGMAPDVMARAFDPFFTTKGAGKGTGLGLSQVYGFVRQSEGHVDIDSRLGAGTTVRIYLPRYRGALPTVAAAARDIPSPSRNQETVLVVEDEASVRDVTVEALRSLGYSVVPAEGPEHALRLVESGVGAQLLFTDVVMPGMNGRALAERVKERQPGIKVLFTTGYSRGAALEDGTLDHESSLLSKPFTVEQLAARIRRTLDERT